MITGWLLKIVVGIAVVGFLLVELGSPLVTRGQLDGIAHDAADNAALHLLDHPDEVEQAKQIAIDLATGKEAALTLFDAGPQLVTVTVQRDARSLLLKKLKQLESWYDVEVTATATKVRR